MYRSAVLASVLVLCAIFAPTALAQNKGKGQTSRVAYSISLEMVNDVNNDGLPNFGDSVMFNVATTSTFVSLNCYQGSSWVYAAGGYPAGSELLLSSNSWTGGAADCMVTVFTTTDGSRTTTLGTLSFRVEA
jgi:hypothetical protein